MKTLGVVVAYFPDLEKLDFNISTYVTELEQLIIWDNTPNPIADKFKFIEDRYPGKIQLMTTGKNEGIALALNQAAKWGISNGYDYLLTMDQDSDFTEGSMAHYLKMIQGVKHTDVLMYMPLYRFNSGDAPVFEDDFRDVELNTTSGSIITLSIFSKIGFFQEELFIDAVDTEISWRAKKHHLKILQVNNVCLNHVLGDRKEFNFCGIKLHTYNYIPMRLYYGLRNYTYLYKKYKDHAFARYYFYNWVFKRGIAILLLETDKRKKLYAMFLGILHGLRGRLGAYTLKY
jgi:rhamnosyltransferase